MLANPAAASRIKAANPLRGNAQGPGRPAIGISDGNGTCGQSQRRDARDAKGRGGPGRPSAHFPVGDVPGQPAAEDKPANAFGGVPSSGKSTLARAILALTPIAAGNVTFDGTSLRDGRAASLARLHRETAMVFQDPYNALNPRISAGEMLAEVLKVQGRTPMYMGIQKLAKADVHWIDLYYSPYINVTRKNVENFYQNPLGRFFLEDAVKN